MGEAREDRLMSEALARQIVMATQVVTDATETAPGKPVFVKVLPGLSPTATSVGSVTNTVVEVGGITDVVSDVTTTLSQLVLPVSLKVHYTVLDENGDLAGEDEFATDPKLVPGASTDPLSLAFVFKPAVRGEDELVDPVRYEIIIDLEVDVDGNVIRTDREADPAAGELPSIRVPVLVPPLRMPAICVFTQHSESDSRWPGETLVMVKEISPIREIHEVVDTLNDVSSVVKTLRDLFSFAAGGGLLDFSGVLGKIVEAVGNAPVGWLQVGSIKVFNDLGGSWIGSGGFDNEASAMLLIGPTGTRIRLYSAEDWDETTGFPEFHEYSTFVARDLSEHGGVSARFGIGFERVPSFGDWDTDPGDSMNDSSESAKWLPKEVGP